MHSIVSLLIGILGAAAALMVPFAPVWAEQTTVVWPAPGTPTVSSTAFFAPPRPRQLSATVPCAVLRAAATRGTAVTVLSTAADGAGLVVRVVAGSTQILLNSRLADSVPVPVVGRCGIQIEASTTQTTITAAGHAVAGRAEPAPVVALLRTDLAPRQAGGLRVTARTSAVFDERATTLKKSLIAAWAVAAVFALGWLWWRARPPPTPAPDQAPAIQHPAIQGLGVGLEDSREAAARAMVAGAAGSRTAGVVVDFAVAVVLAGWAIVGPLSDDDGFAAMIARNSRVAGYQGNYYRWWNASETPFALAQHLLAPLAQISLSPVWLRLPSTLLAVVTWLVVSRAVLPAALSANLSARGGGRVRPERSWWLRLLAAVCFLACWLPFNLGVRPEAYVAAGMSAVLALLWRGRGMPALGAATLIAGVSLTASPAAVVVGAPVLVFAPKIRRIITTGTTSRCDVASRLALLSCLTSVAVVVVFADQSWHALAVATVWHTHFGPSLPWYDEFARYRYLLDADQDGTATKRVPVLLTLTLLPVVALLLSRRGGPGVRSGDPANTGAGVDVDGDGDVHIDVDATTVALGAGAGRLAAVVAVGLGLLWVAPSKWTHYFGALAGVFAAFLVVAVVFILHCARTPTVPTARAPTVPTARGPAHEATVADTPVVDNPVVDNPVVDNPVVDNPVVDNPVVDTPVVDNPVVDNAVVGVVDRWFWGVGAVGAGVVAVAAGVAFSGPNAWWQPVVYDVPWAGGPITPAGLPLNSPLLWAGGAALGYVWVRRYRGRESGRRVLVAAPAWLVATVAAVSVAVLLASFTAAPLRQRSGSLALANLHRLQGRPSCGLGDDVQVLPDVMGSVMTPTTEDPGQAVGFSFGAGYDPGAPPPEPPGIGASQQLWGSLTGGPPGALNTATLNTATLNTATLNTATLNTATLNTGTLTTPWFRLPPVRPDQQVSVSVAGRTDAGNSLSLQFGHANLVPPTDAQPNGDGQAEGDVHNDGQTDGVIPLGSRVPPDPLRHASGEAPHYRLWRTVGVAARQVPPGADRVRIRAVDASSGTDGWLAVTGPRLRQIIGLRQYLAAHSPVLVAWPVAFLFPCAADPVAVHDGLAQAPLSVLEAPQQYSAISEATTDASIGGNFAPLRALGGLGEVSTGLAGHPGLDWGDLLLTNYPSARDTYHTTITWTRVWGLHGADTPPPPPTRTSTP